jgi:diamine N-acetyltransferase
MLRGKKVLLRPLVTEDAVTLMVWENDPTHWRVSETEAPYSLQEIEAFIASSSQIRTNKQVRFMILEKSSKQPVGTIDLFDIDFKHVRANIGVLIADEAHQGKGFASESIDLMLLYAQRYLDLRNFAASIHADNSKSLELFKAKGFVEIGVRKEWYWLDGQWVDEVLYQKIIGE